MSHSARTRYRCLVMEPSRFRCHLSLVIRVLHVSQWFSVRRSNFAPSGGRCPLSESSQPLAQPTVHRKGRFQAGSGFSPGVCPSCLHSHSSGLSCDSLPTLHLSGTWHFLSLGTQSFLATFKMSEFIVELLWYFQSNASSSASGEFQITSQEEPGF